ncbi:hypothetical protein B6U79_03010 [Candidatus Bathyarchaeota archaeon ex4484_231]|nr:MAG: hypothetical protein B6U79_03010 [Candidatus Bathyarchaeota archaeon ex4484_231]
MAELEENERIIETAILLKKALPKPELFSIGKELEIPYFDKFPNGWKLEDEEEAAFEIAARLDDEKLKQILGKHRLRNWTVFHGRFYALKNGKLSTGTAERTVARGIRTLKARYGSKVDSVLKALIKCGGTANIEDLKVYVKAANLRELLDALENRNVIVASYKGKRYREWSILEEMLPTIEVELGIRKKPRKPRVHVATPKAKASPEKQPEITDPLFEERQKIEEMEQEFNEYLEDLLKHRLEKTIRFGKKFSLGFLANYLRELFGPILYFDSLLSITQQYGLANVDIVHEHGRTGRKTGWSLALFGDPGTGKSFSTRDMILGRPSAKIGAHGLPGRNRYCGGITPARFIRIGEAYAGKVYNFIVPEFNDFFRYKGMVEPLKIAMEQGEIKYETHTEVIGPYRFTSFFSVNYNVSVHDGGYTVTIQDPNFNAIEDRMLCRLHRLTKERFIEITKSQMKLALGAIDIQKDAKKIRDHLTLVYAIETGHPLVKNRFAYKPVMITPRVFEVIGKARAAILERIPQKVVKFSARLEDKALRFACAASLMDYFRSDMDFIPVGEEALRYASQLYVEEASVRSKETFDPEEVLKEVFTG